jgi:hypothetical protein
MASTQTTGTTTRPSTPEKADRADARAVDASEAQLVAQIREYKNPNETWLQNLADFADYPLDKAGDLLFDNRIGERIEPGVVKVMTALNHAALRTVRRPAIFQEFVRRGFDVDELDDIEELSIENINEALAGTATKYQSLGALTGAGSGALGIAGMAADIPALVLLALRAVDEYATYFGFDTEKESERCYALMVLAVASTVTDGGRQVALREITRIGRSMAQADDANVIDKRLGANLVKRVAQALVVRLAKGRIGRVVPLLGAVIGGGYNTVFLAEVCKTAYMLYAERWLMRKYGPEVSVDVLAMF